MIEIAHVAKCLCQYCMHKFMHRVGMAFVINNTHKMHLPLHKRLILNRGVPCVLCPKNAIIFREKIVTANRLELAESVNHILK